MSPLTESVPPKLYGGTERVVSFLTEELVNDGHDVTLFASGDSVTRANLVACVPRALRFESRCVDPFAHHMRMVEEVASREAEFDVIHFHVGHPHFPVMRRLETRHVSTMHGRLDIPDLLPLYRTFADEPLVSISDAQRAPVEFAAWQGTVHNGLPPDLLSFRAEQGSYLAFLGRMSPEKGVERAIEIARRTGMLLKMAAKVDKVDEEYFASRIKPLLDDPLIEFVGEINDSEKDRFLGQAAVVLFPVEWPEPFGLVMIEAMACGTPVVAFARGSVREVIADGVSGFVVENVDEAVDAVQRALVLPRGLCRASFEQRFTARRMADDYLTIYEKLLVAGASLDITENLERVAGARLR